MSRKSRITIGAFSAVMATVALTACSSGESGAAGGGSSGGVAGELEVQYFVGGYGDDWWQDVFERFEEEYPDVSVNTHGSSTINEEMKPRWMTNDPPDVVEIEGAGISESQMVSDGQLMDITDWLPTVEMDDGTQLVDQLIAPPNSYDGAIYSVPLIYDNRGTWYDAAWFEENGWNVPANVEEWTESMATIKDETGVAPIATTGVFPAVFVTGALYPAFAGAGGSELLNALIDGEEGAWEDPRVLDVMKVVEDWVDSGFVDDGFASLTHNQAQMNWLLHDNAYVPTGFWLPSEMKGDVPDDFEFGVIPTPFNQPGEKMTVVPETKTIAVAEHAENPEAAKAFIEFIMTEDNAREFAKLSGGMLNIRGLDFSSDPDVPEYLQKANELLNDEERVQLEYMDHPMHADLSTPIGDALVALLLGDTTAEEFVEASEQAAAAFRS